MYVTHSQYLDNFVISIIIFLSSHCTVLYFWFHRPTEEERHPASPWWSVGGGADTARAPEASSTTTTTTTTVCWWALPPQPSAFSAEHAVSYKRNYKISNVQIGDGKQHRCAKFGTIGPPQPTVGFKKNEAAGSAGNAECPPSSSPTFCSLRLFHVPSEVLFISVSVCK